MRRLLNYIREHFQQTRHPLLLLWMAGLLGIGLYWRFGLGNSPYFWYSPNKNLWGAFFYTLPYLGTVIVAGYLGKKSQAFKQAGFWGLSALLIFVPFANQFLLYYKDYLHLFPPPTQYFFRKLFFNLHTSTVYLLIPLLYYFLSKEKGESFYGLTTRGFHARPYAIMLAIMVPLLVWASFQPSFLQAYPRYIPDTAEAYWGISSWLTVGAYESSYALQFVCLELFFRGFMVMALARYLGPYAVYPMVAVYCYIHFGKPFPEALGSIFGGYILGVISLESKSVFGGVFIHIGVALGMELLAFAQSAL